VRPLLRRHTRLLTSRVHLHGADYLPFVLYFFLYFSAPHRDLHSFPTRRSSDLHHLRLRLERVLVRADSHGEPAGADLSGRRAGRSEEHTSELQSHLNLVCRLLLEKKNTKND